MVRKINQSFVYGVSVGGDNFTDRVKETKRLKMDFENGLNVVLISPRRMGKTSLVKKVCQVVDPQLVHTVYIDIYDCRSEYDFYNRFATELLKQTSSHLEQAMENVKRFLVRLAPKISFGNELTGEYSLSLGISPKNYSPEELLSLPEKLAAHIGRHIVVCIDEFQQVGSWPDSLSVQKRMRGIWQQQEGVSYCLFGSRQHMMTQLFQDKRMPFYQFGEPNYLQPIPVQDWTPFIIHKFEEKGLTIDADQVRCICERVDCQSSYVQQLSWNVMINTDDVVTDEIVQQGLVDLLAQCTPLFMEQTATLTTYQLNFLRAVASGLSSEFTAVSNMEQYNLGTKSNVVKVKKTLIEKDFVSETDAGVVISDPVMAMWLQSR